MTIAPVGHGGLAPGLELKSDGVADVDGEEGRGIAGGSDDNGG